MLYRLSIFRMWSRTDLPGCYYSDQPSLVDPTSTLPKSTNTVDRTYLAILHHLKLLYKLTPTVNTGINYQLELDRISSINTMPCRAVAQVALSNWVEWIASFVELSPLREGRNSEMWRFHFGWVAVRQPKPTEWHFTFWRWSCRIGVEIFSKCKWPIAKSLFMAAPSCNATSRAESDVMVCSWRHSRFMLLHHHLWLVGIERVIFFEFQTCMDEILNNVDESIDFGTWTPWRS